MALSPDVEASVELPGLSPYSIQGDRECATLFATLGVETCPTAKGGVQLNKMKNYRRPSEMQHYDITVASEMMAILCLSSDLEDMKKRLGQIVVAYTRDGRAVRADELNVTGALTLLFKDAIKPNLVQTLEGTPALIHGGPFANIAHGCNSVMATKFALKFADVVVTEAGFGADLGAEKFLDIKCRFAGIHPDAVVIVATVRALKMHGGLPKTELGKVDMAALEKGLANLTKHIENVQKFGLPAVVAINAFPTDTREELDFVEEKCVAMGASVALSEVWAKGGSKICVQSSIPR